VTAQLVSVEDGYHLWSENYDRELEDVFAIQDEISRSIVETLRPTLLGEKEGAKGEEERKLVLAPTRSMEAYDYYLLGRHYWEGRYKEGLATALRHFEKAVELDPEYALPYTGVADSYTVLGLCGYLRPEVSHTRATAAALRALELDEGLSEAHGSLGFYELFLGLDWEKSATELRKAIELKPDNAKAHAWLGYLRCLQGRFQEAFDEVAIARRLDPLSSYVSGLAGAVRNYAGEPDTAVALLEEALGKDPDDLFLVWLLESVYLQVQRYVDAMRLAERAEVLSGGAWHFKSSAAATYAQAGRLDQARAVRDELYAAADSRNVSPIWLAWIHIGLGQKKEALFQLERTVTECTSWGFTIPQDPIFSPLWPDPRFRELAGKVGSGVVSRAWERAEAEEVAQRGSSPKP
jgi:tetratricopeptide (TPR) repeat protein